MSMSEMSKARYLEIRRSVRDNGIRYVASHIECPLEREDMFGIFVPFTDWLEERQKMQQYESKSTAFRLTSALTL